MHELGIHPRTLFRQGLERSRNFIARRQHSGRCVGRLSSGFAAFDDQYPYAFFAQFDGKRQPNDSPANDDRVPRFHK